MLGSQNQIRECKNASKINGYEVICIMSEVIYTKLELNAAKTFITGIWCDGVYFSAEPPLKVTTENEQWVRIETAKLAKDHEDCVLWRLERQVELKREAMAAWYYDKRFLEGRNERWKSKADYYLENFAREELEVENKRLKTAWTRAVQHKAVPSVRDTDRDRKMLYEVSVKGRKLKDVAAQFGISSTRVSQVISREQRRDRWFWISRYKNHVAEGQLQEPEPEIFDLGQNVDWTPETQHKEFELLRGIM